MTYKITKTTILKSALFGHILGLLLLSAIMSGCKKEYIDKYNIVPGDSVKVVSDNYIASFQIKEFSADTTLKAAIVEDTIVIYWPSYKQLPATIKPEIILAEKATISPASGAEVAFKTGTQFQVTSESGEVKAYILKVAINQPFPAFAFGPTSVYQGMNLNVVGGDFWQLDTAITKVYFINSATGQSYPAEVVSVAINGPTVFIGENIPTGTTYDIKVIQGIRTIYNGEPTGRNAMSVLAIETPFINNQIGFPFSLKAGDTFTLRGNRTSQITDLYISEELEGPKVKLEIMSTATGKLTAKIPAGTPAGDYQWVRPVSLLSPTGAEATLYGLITINP